MRSISKCVSAITLVTTFSSNSFAQSQQIKDAIKATENEQYEKATALFKAIITKETTNAEAYYYLGENLLNAGKTDSAEIVFQKGKNVNEFMPLNGIGLARISNIKGNSKDALSMIETVYSRYSEKGFKVKDEMKIRGYVEGAEALLDGKVKNTAKAMELVGKALALDEFCAAAFIVKGDAQYESDQLNVTEPVLSYKKAAELDHTSAIALSKAAYMYYRAKMFKKAIEYYSEALKMDVNFAPAYSGRGDAYYYDNQLHLGVDDYKRYLELNKGNVRARIRYAAFLYLKKAYDESLTELASVEKVLGNQDAYVNRIKGYNLYEKGDYVGAKSALELFISKVTTDKINSSDYEYLGRSYQKLNDEEKMSIYFEKAVIIDFKNKSGLINEIIAVYKDKKNYAMQVYWYKKKVKLGSKEANDFYYMGQAAYSGDLYQDCDSAYMNYSKIMPDYALAYYYRAWAQDALDKTEQKKWIAKEQYEKFLSMLKPEEFEKMNKKMSEAYFFLARYNYFGETKNYGLSKCYAIKVVALKANEKWVQVANDFMKYKEIASATEDAECK